MPVICTLFQILYARAYGKNKAFAYRFYTPFTQQWNVYLLDLTKTKDNLFCQLLAASGLYSDLVLEIVFKRHCQKIFKWQNFLQINFCYNKKMGSYCVQTDPLQLLPVSSSFRHMTQKGPSFRLCTPSTNMIHWFSELLAFS